MTDRTRATYFPVTAPERAILERVRDHELAERHDVVDLLDLIADSGLSASELEQALTLFDESRREEGLAARFEALEARLTERLNRALAEMEGRLSQRVGRGADVTRVAETVPAAPVERGHETPADGLASSTGGAEVDPSAVVAIRVGDTLFQASKAAEAYVALWSWLLDCGHIARADLPIASGSKRYLAALEPVHRNGRAFFNTQEVDGVFLETNMSRANMVAAAGKVLEIAGLDWEVLVGDGGARSVSSTSTGRSEARAAFWNALLAVSHERSPLHRGVSQAQRGYSWIGTRRGPVMWNYAVRQHDAQAELYIDTDDAAENKRIFDALFARRVAIERAFGEPLDWQRLDDKRASRVRYVVRVGGWTDDSTWPEAIEALVDGMTRMEAALAPHVAAVAS